MEEKLILVTGSGGELGSRFTVLYPQKNVIHAPKQIDFDISKPAQIKAILNSFDFKAVINFKEITNSESVEFERGNLKSDTWLINVEGVNNLVSAIEPLKQSIHFIQISSDQVFSGEKLDPGPYLENHQPEGDSKKLSWYGYTKAEAERIILGKLGGYSTVLRISETNYAGKILELYKESRLPSLPGDQKITLSDIDEICLSVERVIQAKLFGVFHIASPDTGTPYDIASYILEKKGIKAEIKQMSGFPRFGGLNIKSTESILGIKFSPWRKMVETQL